MIPKKIAIIGASTVQGAVDPEGGGWVGRIRKWHESRRPRRNFVFNLGVSGNTTTDILRRLLPECSERKPGLIIYSCGLNDSRRVGSLNGPHETPKEKFKYNLRELVKTGRGIADVIFVSINPIDDTKTLPIPWNKSHFFNQVNAEEYAGITEEIVSSESIPYLDVWSYWIKRNYHVFLYEDGLHPNSLGHKDIFVKVKEFLNNIYKD